MNTKESALTVSSFGHSLALGVAWHLDTGFWSILFDTLLGWVYVGYKFAQYTWPFG